MNARMQELEYERWLDERDAYDEMLVSDYLKANRALAPCTRNR